MNTISKNITKLALLLVVAISILSTSCNKGYEEISATQMPASGPTLAEIINTDPNYTLLRDQLVRTGLINALGQRNGSFTLLAPDNAAFANTNPALTSTAVINTVFTVTAMTGILQYHVITNRILAAQIPTTFPNAQYPTLISLAANPLVRFPVCLGRNSVGAWANQVPIVTPDAVVAQNGVIHRLFAVLVPPSSGTMLSSINANANLTYLSAAIVRADTNTAAAPSSYTSILSTANPLASFTLFAPNDAAFRQLLIGAIAQALIANGMFPPTAIATATALASTPAVFSNPALFGALSAATVRGILAYHFLAPAPNGTTVFGNRVFTPNLPLVTTPLPTFVNGVIPAHPGVIIDRSGAAPRLQGLGNGVGNFANFVAGSTNINNLSGVYHIIDRVLLPQ